MRLIPPVVSFQRRDGSHVSLRSRGRVAALVARLTDDDGHVRFDDPEYTGYTFYPPESVRVAAVNHLLIGVGLLIGVQDFRR